MFSIQEAHSIDVWVQPYKTIRVPRIFNLRRDPFERADHETIGYDKWFFEHVFVLVPAQHFAGKFLSAFREFPPRQKPASFGIDQVLEKLQAGQRD